MSRRPSDLSKAVERLREAREAVEALLAEHSGPGPALSFDSTQRLRDGFANAIELDAIRREEKRAEEKAKPSNADKFAEALEAAFEASRRPATLADLADSDD